VDRLACVNLPVFPLQLLLRRYPEWISSPVAVVAEDKPQAAILWVNRKAWRAGVRPGFRYAAGSALAPGLYAGTVPAAEIEKELSALADRLTRFTPEVEPSREEPGVFWLNGIGLNLLYASLEGWMRAIHADIENRGFRGSVVVGFTRFGTYAVAKTRQEKVIFEDPAPERATAREVSLDYLDLDPDLRDVLSKLGIRTVDAFLSLPAGGLYERFGPKAYRLYRMASGDLWEPLQPRVSVEPIQQKLLLDDPETDVTRLLFLIKRLLHSMLVTLADRSEALAGLILRLLIYKVGWQEERVRPAAPTLDSVQLLDLVRLRLATMKFSAGVVEIELTAKGCRATTEQLRLFAERPARDLSAADRALARLRAEFGDQAVVRAKLTDGHLPEARFKWEPVQSVQLPRPKLEASRTLVRRIFSRSLPLPPPPRTPHDDGWLLRGPKYGAVDKLSGPYIFSGGWWNREIHREYYFAETRRGDLLWVYYDRVRRRWFLQGRVE
jgi:protein ImuB